MTQTHESHWVTRENSEVLGPSFDGAPALEWAQGSHWPALAQDERFAPTQ